MAKLLSWLALLNPKIGQNFEYLPKGVPNQLFDFSKSVEVVLKHFQIIPPTNTPRFQHFTF